MKKTFTLSLIIICFSFISLLAQNYKFDTEIFESQFENISQIANNVIISGSNGILLISNDGGNNWDKRFELTKNDNFQKMTSFNNFFWALIKSSDLSAPSYLLKSPDGIAWEKYDIDINRNCYDIVSNDEGLYLLSQFEDKSIQIDKIDKNNIYNSLISSSDQIRCKSFQYLYYYTFIDHLNFILSVPGIIYRINLENKNMDSISTKNILETTKGYTPAKNFKKLDNDIYMTLDSTLMKSEDMGKNWSIVNNEYTMDFVIRFSDVYTIEIKNQINHCYKSRFITRRIIGNAGDIQSDWTSDRFDIGIEFNDVKLIDNNTIVICGKNSFAAVSHDIGKTWNIINHLKSYSTQQIWVDDHTGFAGTKYGVIQKTTDGGKFWRPQLYTDTLRALEQYGLSNPDEAIGCSFEYPDYFSINSKNELFAIELHAIDADVNEVRSFDLGETIYPYNNSNSHGSTYMDYAKSYISSDLKYFYATDRFSFDGKKFSWYTDVVIYDKENNFIGRKKIDEIIIYRMSQKGNTLYAFAGDASDSLTTIPDNKYFLMKSLNGGNTWEHIKQFLPFSSYKNINMTENYLEVLKADTNKSTQILRYDLETGVLLDSCLLNYSISSLYYKAGARGFIFLFDTILINEDVDKDIKTWTAYPVGFRFKPSSHRGNIFYGEINGELGKMTITGMSDVKETENDDYLYAMPPYPVPAKDYVKGKFYYYYAGGLASTNINIYNSMGVKVATNKDLEIEPKNGYTAELKWNCSAAPTGTYLIVISTPNGKSQTLPVMVAR